MTAISVRSNIPVLEKRDGFYKEFFNGYFNWGSTRYTIVGYNPKTKITTVKKEKIQAAWFQTLMKILCLFTIIIPLIGVGLVLGNRNENRIYRQHRSR